MLQTRVAHPATGLPEGNRSRRSGRKLFLAATLTASFLLAGCSAGDPLAETVNAGTTNYIAGDGSVAEYEPAARGEPVELSGQLLDGTTLSSSDWSGDVVVLNAWYAACAPCRVEAPDLVALHDQFRPEGVRFYGINLRDEEPTASAFERSFGVEYPSFQDKNGKILLALTEYVPPQAVPTTLVLDREGRVAARLLGIADRSTLESIITDVLGEPAPDRS